MHIIVTVKLIPTSPEEQSALPDQVQVVQAHFADMQKDGMLGPPDDVQVRYLIAGEPVIPVQKERKSK